MIAALGTNSRCHSHAGRFVIRWTWRTVSGSLVGPTGPSLFYTACSHATGDLTLSEIWWYIKQALRSHPDVILGIHWTPTNPAFSILSKWMDVISITYFNLWLLECYISDLGQLILSGSSGAKVNCHLNDFQILYGLKHWRVSLVYLGFNLMGIYFQKSMP